MANFVTPVTGYGVRIGPSNFYAMTEHPVFIACFGEDGDCIFHFADMDDLPHASMPGRIPHVWVHASQYPWYIDLLRNEGPLQLSIDRDEPRLCHLRVRFEPAGENE